MTHSYSGVGTRQLEDPNKVKLIRGIASILGRRDYILRSGHAPGSDMCFEDACDSVGGLKEIFLPWELFEGSLSPYFNPPEAAFIMAEKIHPYWSALKQGGQKLMARNCQQVLGKDLSDPVEFVIAYTKSGLAEGGTGLAINLAQSLNIPVFNLGSKQDVLLLKQLLKEIMDEN